MMYIHSNNETDKRINVSKIANISTMGDNSTAAGCNSGIGFYTLLGAVLAVQSDIAI